MHIHRTALKETESFEQQTQVRKHYTYIRPGLQSRATSINNATCEVYANILTRGTTNHQSYCADV